MALVLLPFNLIFIYFLLLFGPSSTTWDNTEQVYYSYICPSPITIKGQSKCLSDLGHMNKGQDIHPFIAL